MADLAPRFFVGDLELTSYPFGVLREDVEVDLGAPQNAADVIESLMVDGELVSSSRSGNRTLTVPVLVEGGDLLALAANEATLIQACEKARNTFTVDPGDGFGPPTVFDTFRIQAVHTRDSRYEAALMRRWDLTIPALPWGRAATLVTQTLTPAVVTPTVVDDCVSLTNWTSSGAYPASLSTTTYLGEDVIAASFTSVGSGFRGTVVSYSGTKPTTAFVGLDVNWDGNSNTDKVVKLQGSTPQSSEVVTLGTGTYTRYWFATPAAASSWAFTFEQTINGVGSSSVSVSTWRIANLVSSADVGNSGVMSVDTLGSVRSVGSVTLSRATAITWAMVYADPQLDQFSPSVQGTWKYGRAGTYVVYAASGSFVAGDVVSLTFTDSASRAVTTAQTEITAEVAALPFQPIGTVELGGFQTGLIGVQTVTATKNGASATAPSLRLFRLADDTTLTYLAGMSGTSLVLQAPSVDYHVGGAWMDGVDVRGKIVSPGFPVIEVPRTALYVEANNSAAAPVTSTLAYYDAYHTYSAR